MQVLCFSAWSIPIKVISHPGDCLIALNACLPNANCLEYYMVPAVQWLHILLNLLRDTPRISSQRVLHTVFPQALYATVSFELLLEPLMWRYSSIHWFCSFNFRLEKFSWKNLTSPGVIKWTLLAHCSSHPLVLITANRSHFFTTTIMQQQ